MSRRFFVLATMAAALTVLALELVIRWVGSEPPGSPRPVHRLSRDADVPLPTLWPVPSYRLVDQAGQTRTPAELRGSVWIADFIFTSCKSVCPVLTAKMVQVQRAIQDPRLRFVSFSVDPERDTPEALQAYRKRWAPDESRWSLLSTTKESLADLTKGMKTFVEPQPDPDATLHTSELFLVDAKGRVRGLYGTDGDGFAQLVPDTHRLLAELGSAARTASPPVASEEDGATLYRQLGCAGCHGVPAIAPSLAGLAGRTVMLADGRTTTASPAYLRESLLDPGAKVVATYPPSMPSYRGHLTDAQLTALVQYLQELKGPAGTGTPATVASEGAAVDPVCGMSIHAGPDTPHLTHDGHTVYFCSEHCRERFVANPGAYAR
ncbi:MAG TPA: SCO family protein [Myxococcaceae bacterium]|nr:SCO family protein [Myxococcaceae bacterium]